jgi:hypothetical protein
MRQSHCLRNGRSYEDDLPLNMTGMSILLLNFQILEWSESNVKPEVANFCKNWLKMAKYKAESLSQEQ